MSSNFGLAALSQVFNDSSSEVRNKIIGMYTFLIGYNILAWVIALIVFAGNSQHATASFDSLYVRSASRV